MPKRFLRSYRAKVTIAFLLAMFFILALNNFLVYRFSSQAQFNYLRDRLMVIAQTASLLVDPELLEQVPLVPGGVESPQYQQIASQLRRIKEANPVIKYIYTLKKTDKENIWQFVVDPDPVVKGLKKDVTSYPGDRYDVSAYPQMQQAFMRPAADTEITSDEWGALLSGYAPVRSRDGKAVAALGVDISADDVWRVQRRVMRRGLIVLAAGILLSFFVGFIISRRITRPVNKLVEGTRRIAADDLEYKVQVKGDNELAELARSFNRMASSLLESRKKLQDYFSRVLQSFIRIIEAKDHYTRGHSDRVADYAERIAENMGLPRAKADLCRTAAELHDIGKLGIHENILNKGGKLTDQEWQDIRRHPATAEDILKPLALDEDILAAVRSHHERYDGTGYPDGLAGDKINILAQIIAVADTYDAMTSSRSYRPAMPKEAALAELRKASGRQFNPQVVAAFLRTKENA